MTKLEEAAKVHWERTAVSRRPLSTADGPRWKSQPKSRREIEIEGMRAALQVLREPDEAMLNANEKCPRGVARQIWYRMIDAILQEGE